MTYEELKKIAQPHIRENDSVPSNAFWLLNQLHIPFKNEKQCEEDYKDGTTPLDNHPAFLSIRNNEKIVYFNSRTRYWNFYIFHEIAHYLLGHEGDSPQNELDANMLACILAAPVENLPSVIKNANDISALCQIPIDKAEEYWAEIKERLPKNKKLIKRKIIIASIIAFFILCSSTVGFLSAKVFFKQEQTPTTTHIPAIHTPTPTENISQNQDVVVTISGTKYHMPDCRYVKNKTNVIEEDIHTAMNDGYEPCKICIK